MKKLLLVCLILTGLSSGAAAQDFGLSFSYFIPKNGYFSTPISPFSIRGLGVNLNRYIAIETGGSLYRMSGLNLKDLPFETKDALLGPNFTLLVPLELVLQLQANRVQFDIKGGGFFFVGFANKLNYGNLDRAIRTAEGWEVANSDFTFDNHPGWGYHAGAELTVYVTQQVGVSIEANYLVGQAKFPMEGTVIGGSTDIQTHAAAYPDAKIDLTGIEFSLGLIFSTGNARPHRR